MLAFSELVAYKSYCPFFITHYLSTFNSIYHLWFSQNNSSSESSNVSQNFSIYRKKTVFADREKAPIQARTAKKCALDFVLSCLFHSFFACIASLHPIGW